MAPLKIENEKTQALSEVKRGSAAAKPATRRKAGGRPKKGCEAPRGEDTAKQYRSPEAHDAKRGGPQRRVQSTEP